MTIRTSWTVGLASAIALVANRAAAQPKPDPGAFRAMTGPATESVPGGTMMVIAYGIIGTLLLLYVIRLARMAAKNRELLSAIEARSAAAPTKTSE